MPHSIALCITELEPGGAEKNLVELAVRLDLSRFRPTVYCLAPPPQRPELPERLAAAGVPVHFLGGRSIWRFAGVMRQLDGLLRAQRPVLLQSFLFHANVVGRLAARRAGVGRVLSGLRVAERHARWHLLLDRWTQRWVDRWVCVSEGVAAFARTEARLPADRLTVIANGVDAGQYPAKAVDLATFGIAPGRRVVTFVGRLERQKAVDWLLETAAVWLPQAADCDLLIVGDGPLRPALERQSRELGIAGRVRFIGWRRDVPAILAASAALVLPAAWEGMPNCVLEAMASRLPVVASQVEGVAELLGSTGGEQLAAFRDTAAFSAKIAAILADARLAESLGHQNRRRAEQSFSLGAMVGAYQRLWGSLLDG